MATLEDYYTPFLKVFPPLKDPTLQEVRGEGARGILSASVSLLATEWGRERCDMDGRWGGKQRTPRTKGKYRKHSSRKKIEELPTEPVFTRRMRMCLALKLQRTDPHS